jgi:hypothetical protein
MNAYQNMANKSFKNPTVKTGQQTFSKKPCLVYGVREQT